jgi:hypothetical protein
MFARMVLGCGHAITREIPPAGVPLEVAPALKCPTYTGSSGSLLRSHTTIIISLEHHRPLRGPTTATIRGPNAAAQESPIKNAGPPQERA